MDWSISQILKQLKNSQACIIRCKNSHRRLEFFNLIMHSCSFIKQISITAENYNIIILLIIYPRQYL